MRTRSSGHIESSIDLENVDALDDTAIDSLLAQAKENIKAKDSLKNIDELQHIKQTWSSIPKLDDSDVRVKTLAKTGVVKLVVSSDPKSAPTTFRKVVDPVAVKKAAKTARDSTAGKNWFDMSKPEMTPELKRDLQLLKMRNVLDPKRHYKKDNTPAPKYFQTGTIIEGNTEFYSARLTKKQRQKTLAGEILADSTARSYFKRKYGEIQSSKRSGRKGDWKKRMEARKKF